MSGTALAQSRGVRRAGLLGAGLVGLVVALAALGVGEPPGLAASQGAAPSPTHVVFLPSISNGTGGTALEGGPASTTPTGVIVPSATPTRLASPTTTLGSASPPTATPTETVTVVPFASATNSPTLTATATLSLTLTATSSSTATASRTSTASSTVTPLPTATGTPTASLTPTISPTPTVPPTVTISPTPTVFLTATQTATPRRLPPPDPNCVITSVQNMASLTLNPPPMDFPTPAYKVNVYYPTPPPAPTPTPPSSAAAQLYVLSVGGSLTCLSCSPPAGSGAPDPSRNKVMAQLSPKGDWITFVGEMANHPAYSGGTANVNYEIANGWWGDLWVTTPDGSRWYNLTNLVIPRGSTTPLGTLAPKLSPDETKIAWASLVGFSPTYPIGTWRLMVADFVVSPTGVPSLQNVRDLSQPAGTWYEPVDWSPDSKTILVSSDAGLPYQYGADDFAVDVATGTFTDLTNQPLYWEEHGVYSPSGRKIVHESQYPNAALLPQNATLPYDQWRPQLRTEVYVMNVDGSQAMQLTGLNTPVPWPTPDPELDLTTASVGAGDVWNASGTQLIIPQTSINPWTGIPNTVTTWLVTFAGPCG